MNKLKTTEVADTTGVYGITLVDTCVYFTTRDKQLRMIDLENTLSAKRLLVNQTLFRGLVWDQQNTLYICDWNGHSIVQYLLDSGKATRLVGAGNSYESYDGTFKNASFCFPIGITMHNQRYLFVTELRCIRRVDMLANTVETIAGSNSKSGYLDGPAKDALFDEPTGIVRTEDGTLYVSDCGNHCVRKIKDGIVSTLFAKGQFTYATGIQQQLGILFVADIHSVWKVRSGNNETKMKMFSQKGLSGLATDRFGNIFVGIEGKLCKIQNLWDVERLLWIAKLKEDPLNCPLSQLPKDIIHEVCSLL